MKQPTTISTARHTYEIVKSVPKGYEIWNIGKNMAEGYLPLCRVIEGTHNVELDTLKAIECRDAQTILAAMGYGPKTVREMESFIKKYENDKVHSYQADRMKKALPILKTIKFD